MRRPTHAASRQPRLGKAALLLASLALLAAFGVSGVIAYIVDGGDKVLNTFSPVKVEASLSEEFSNQESKKSNIKMTNESEVPVYVRATLAVYWKDATGAVVPQPKSCEIAGGEVLDESGWFKVGDIYYYANALEPDAQTKAMLSDITAVVVDGFELHVDVLHEAIQAEPVSAVEEAWGADVTVTGSGTLQAKR